LREGLELGLAIIRNDLSGTGHAFDRCYDNLDYVWSCLVYSADPGAKVDNENYHIDSDAHEEWVRIFNGMSGSYTLKNNWYATKDTAGVLDAVIHGKALDTQMVLLEKKPECGTTFKIDKKAMRGDTIQVKELLKVAKFILLIGHKLNDPITFRGSLNMVAMDVSGLSLEFPKGVEDFATDYEHSVVIAALTAAINGVSLNAFIKIP
jgi:hypothetical protein